jgi:hypothetical protein
MKARGLASPAKLQTQEEEMHIKYWDSIAETYPIWRRLRSRPRKYAVLYRLDDGRYLGGIRHKDRGDLMTEVCYAKTARDAMPGRWS